MPNTSMLKVRGLHTFSSYLSAVPEGALLEASNVVIDKDGVIEPRRGMTQYGTIGLTSNDTAKQLMLYKDRAITHFSTTLAWDNGTGTFTNFPGTFNEVDPGLRMKYIEMNGNLYVTTSDGIKKLATTGATAMGSTVISNAGAVKAVDMSLMLDSSSPNGFLLANQEVAYRMVWGYKDVNNNLLLGTPSYRSVIRNQTGTPKNVFVTFTVPSEVNSTYFYQIYRTSNAVFDGSGDEMKLVYEDVYTGGSTITILDEQPEELRDTGVPLYTNEFSGEGILQANDRPPVSKDIAIYKSTAFYANTRGPHRNDLTLLGLDGMVMLGVTSHTGASPATITTTTPHNLVTGAYVVVKGAGAADGTFQVIVLTPTSFTVPSVARTGTDVINVFTSYITITKGVSVNRYFFVGRPEISTITVTNTTVDGEYFTIAAYDNTLKFYLWFFDTVAGTAVDPLIPGYSGIQINYNSGTATTTTIAASIVAALDATGGFDSSNLANVVTTETSNSGFSEAVGLLSNTGWTFATVQNGFGEEFANQYARLSTLASPASRIEDTAKSLVSVINRNGTEVVSAFYTPDSSSLPGTMSFEAKTIDSTPYTIQANGATTGGMFNPDITTAITSTNEIRPNRIYFSKVQQPEAVPATNNIDIGPKDKAILRILGLRDSLFIFKEEGIYRLTGDTFVNFNVTLFDNSSILLAPDTAAVLNNQIYGLTSQGIATVSETGVAIISRPIENIFVTVTSPNYLFYKTASFAVGYESDRSYVIWIPDHAGDTDASVAYRFNTFTQTWTSWDMPAICGVVNVLTNKLYIGASDLNLIEIERKNLNRTDYADRRFNLLINPNAINGRIVSLSSVAGITAGDVLIQTQYVTQAQVIRLAKKFALDPGVPDTVGNLNKDYYRNFDLPNGCNLQTQVSLLMTQVNSDLGSAFDTTYSSTFSTFQTEYNAMVSTLNLSPLLFHTNYETSNGTVDYELAVLSKNQNNNTVTITIIEPIIEGPIVQHVSIPSQVIWAPMTFEDPSMLKHIRESTIMFDNAGISTATIGFNTDLSGNFEDIPFTLEGDGSWGVWIWSETSWGGQGSGRPFRTLIPRQKQRCRFIRARFKHNAAYYKYGILGLSYTFEINSERGYR